MKKKSIILVILVLLVIIAGLFIYKNFNFRYESNINSIDYNQPKCSFAISTIGIYKYAFSTKQSDMNVYVYAVNGIKGGGGFYFGQKTSSDQSLVKQFYDSFVDDENKFNSKYPNESKGSGTCVVNDIEGYCGFYQGKLSLFSWKDTYSYNVINNFSFSEKELEPIVSYFNNCNLK